MAWLRSPDELQTCAWKTPSMLGSSGAHLRLSTARRACDRTFEAEEATDPRCTPWMSCGMHVNVAGTISLARARM
eukprot:3425402-Rhodomonas_salina.1